MGVRSDLRYDGDRCRACGRLLASGDVRRVVHADGAVDVLVICAGCHQPTVLPWIRDAA